MCDLPKEDRNSGTEILTSIKSPEFYKGTKQNHRIQENCVIWATGITVSDNVNQWHKWRALPGPISFKQPGQGSSNNNWESWHLRIRFCFTESKWNSVVFCLYEPVNWILYELQWFILLYCPCLHRSDLCHGLIVVPHMGQHILRQLWTLNCYSGKSVGYQESLDLG